MSGALLGRSSSGTRERDREHYTVAHVVDVAGGGNGRVDEQRRMS